jgi:hypothetical protein
MSMVGCVEAEAPSSGHNDPGTHLCVGKPVTSVDTTASRTFSGSVERPDAGHVPFDNHFIVGRRGRVVSASTEPIGGAA